MNNDRHIYRIILLFSVSVSLIFSGCASHTPSGIQYMPETGSPGYRLAEKMTGYNGIILLFHNDSCWWVLNHMVEENLKTVSCHVKYVPPEHLWVNVDYPDENGKVTRTFSSNHNEMHIHLDRIKDRRSSALKIHHDDVRKVRYIAGGLRNPRSKTLDAIHIAIDFWDWVELFE